MSFDYGVEERLLNHSKESHIHTWEKEGSFTGLCDADAIPYIVGYVSTDVQYEEFLKEGKDGDIWLEKKAHACSILNRWLKQAQCDSALFYFTDSANNFRLKIGTLKTYKEQRQETPKPPFFYELREFLLEFHDGKLSQGNEADDDVSIEAWRRHRLYDGELWSEQHKYWSDFCVLSMDKDLCIIPGWHVDVNTGEKYWVDPIGELKPTWKAKEVNDYEYHPLFDKNPYELRDCVPVAASNNFDVSKRDYFSLKAMLKHNGDKWSEKILWGFLGPNGLTLQDTFTRGAKKGQGKFKRVQVGMKEVQRLHKLKGNGLKFFYSQIIVGDTIDNYPGLPNHGETCAYETLDHLTDELSMYDAVLDLYIKHYKDESHARDMLLEQGQLANMQRWEGDLWQPPKPNALTFQQ